MNVMPPFLDLPAQRAEQADVLLLPLPFEGTVSYGRGTARAPAAVWEASRHIEDWDEQTDFDLDRLGFYSDPPLAAREGERPGDYLGRVLEAARRVHAHGGLVLGVGGEHSVTAPLVRAAVEQRGVDPAGLTVIQIDAHADLRDQYQGDPHSHACVMRRVVEMGARVLAFGVRSAERAEMEYGLQSGRVRTFWAHRLATHPAAEREHWLRVLGELRGSVYLSIDLDGLDPALCPAVGTPQPGGLDWWTTLAILEWLLHDNHAIDLVGGDLCEAAPQEGNRLGEFTVARLICKILAFYFSSRK